MDIYIETHIPDTHRNARLLSHPERNQATSKEMKQASGKDSTGRRNPAALHSISCPIITFPLIETMPYITVAEVASQVEKRQPYTAALKPYDIG